MVGRLLEHEAFIRLALISYVVHDDNETTRLHHVPFPFSPGLGKKSDIEPVILNQIETARVG